MASKPDAQIFDLKPSQWIGTMIVHPSQPCGEWDTNTEFSNDISAAILLICSMDFANVYHILNNVLIYHQVVLPIDEIG